MNRIVQKVTKFLLYFQVRLERRLILTGTSIYIFNGLELSKHKEITSLAGLIKSTDSTTKPSEFILLCPGDQDIHLKGLGDEMLLFLQQYIQARFVNKVSEKVFQIYEVPE